ncbi:aminotransferase class III-fold pyridoxal phosphate-dependent enzyme, partial [bacterium]
NAAIQEQLGKISHSSFLGFTHPLAVELASRLCGFFPDGTLERVFFSDDGSTAVECALKMAVQYRMQTGEPERNRFVAFANGYHGDTLGAASLGGVGHFFERFKGTGYPVQHVSTLEELRTLPPAEIAGVVIEPLIQGVNEMRPWPAGMLTELREWCDETGAHLILDEVMTGFGRTGKMFACHHESVIPDFLCLAKGLTGGYLPMAATLTTGKIYDAFLGSPEKAFYYGHSYTANPLGCAAALASLDLFESEQTFARLPEKIERLADGLAALKSRHPMVHEVRQCGFIAGIELRRPDGEKFPPGERFGESVLPFTDPDGMALALVGIPGAESEPGWSNGDVPAEHAIRGFHGVTLLLDSAAKTAAVLTDVFGFKETGREGSVIRFKVSGDAEGSVVDIYEAKGFLRGHQGGGSVHHIAFRAADDAE